MGKNDPRVDACIDLPRRPAQRGRAEGHRARRGGAVCRTLCERFASASRLLLCGAGRSASGKGGLAVLGRGCSGRHGGLNLDRRHRRRLVVLFCGCGRRGCSRCALEGGAIDRQAFGRQLDGIAVAHALDAVHHVLPVLEGTLLALFDNLGRNARVDALDGFEFGLGGLVGVHRSEGGHGRERRQGGQSQGSKDRLEHGFSSGRGAVDAHGAPARCGYLALRSVVMSRS